MPEACPVGSQGAGLRATSMRCPQTEHLVGRAARGTLTVKQDPQRIMLDDMEFSGLVAGFGAIIMLDRVAQTVAAVLLGDGAFDSEPSGGWV